MEMADFCGEWIFTRPGRTGREERPARAELRDGVLTVVVPHHGRGGLRLVLRLEGEGLEGEYVLGPATEHPTRGTVGFRVREGGRSLLGHPAGFVNRERWEFLRPS